ncbi:hypothetical protein C1645_742947 [Glomus cerebriforme]|uniref:Uncharacterized protein n=1 Tax=Glomus cerebriforme TaxID=658196 RepID=A0A397SBB6_9GLOM|nr:hypothetical protein C1645_742947 [Glomus cerebriforme]
MSYIGFKYRIFIALVVIFVTFNFAHPTYDLENPISRTPRRRQEPVKDPKKPKKPKGPQKPPERFPIPNAGAAPDAGGPVGSAPPDAGGPPGGAPPSPAGVGENFVEIYGCSDGTMKKRLEMGKCGRWF